jgi:hypothetical protein
MNRNNYTLFAWLVNSKKLNHATLMAAMFQLNKMSYMRVPVVPWNSSLSLHLCNSPDSTALDNALWLRFGLKEVAYNICHERRQVMNHVTAIILYT